MISIGNSWVPTIHYLFSIEFPNSQLATSPSISECKNFPKKITNIKRNAKNKAKYGVKLIFLCIAESKSARNNDLVK